MTYTGEWLQQDDYTSVRPPGSHLLQGARDELVVDPREGYDVGYHRGVMANAIDPSGFSDAEISTPVVLITSYDSVNGPTSEAYFARAGSAFRVESAYTARRRTPPPPVLPPGAVGFERAPGLPTVVGAAATPTITHAATLSGLWFVLMYALQPNPGMSVNTTAAPPALVSWNAGAAFDAAITGYDASGNPILDPAVAAQVASFPPRPDGTVESMSLIDVTGQMFGGDDACLAWVFWTRFPALPALSDPLGVGTSGRAGAVDPFVSITWTLRPPLHRFIYADQPRPRITRVYPRDDGLGTSTATRLHPIPASRQGSNRSGPGSYQ